MNPRVSSLPTGSAAREMASSLAPGQVEKPMAASLAPAQVEKPAETARLGILGAAGYSGGEFLRLASAHPGLVVAYLGVREAAARSRSDLFPGWSGAAPLPPLLEPDQLLEEARLGAIDTIVSAMPHGVFKTLLAGEVDEDRGAGSGAGGGRGEAWGMGRDAGAGPRIVDLSGDHRDGAAGFVYGLPELVRHEVRQAHRIANPGCYATAAILALAPAAAAGWLSGPLTVSALSGVTGAGRAASLHTAFAEVQDGASYYRAGGDHAHVSEVERVLGRLAPGGVSLAFTPQLVPMSRGILLTAVASLQHPRTEREACSLYEERYAGEPFVRLLPDGTWPATRAVRASNRCDLSVQVQHGGRTLVVLAALDNLVKGAAGQAVQNLNLMLGWPESTGLPREGLPW